MSRVPDVPESERTPDQRRIAAEIAGTRGGVVRGPFAIWLRLPDIADHANQFGSALRLKGTLDRRLFELMVLIIARHWNAQYEWFAHAHQALTEGVEPAVITAIQNNRVPEFHRDDERAIYELVDELNTTKVVSPQTYDRSLQRFGLETLIEIITAAGFYTMVAMMLNAFDAPVPDGSRPLPDGAK